MCTAISYNKKEKLFGRNLDVVCGYGEKVVITPQNYNFKMKFVSDLTTHKGIIGTAAVIDGYPLYFDAMNENGLCMAGLNFPNNAFYHTRVADKTNIAPFEFIPFLLGKCENIVDAEALLCDINIVNENFSENLPLTPLHWMISDGEKSLTVESDKEGLHFYKNEVGVLTNNPPFLKQILNLEKYIDIFTKKQPQNNGEEGFSVGLDGVGIPGDYSSSSRFVKASFVKMRSPKNMVGEEAVNQFFKILSSVAMPKGCVITETGECEYTRYSCCFDINKRECYYTTYNNPLPSKIILKNYDLNKGELIFVQNI